MDSQVIFQKPLKNKSRHNFAKSQENTRLYSDVV